MKITDEMVKTLKPYLLKELPRFIEKKIKEILSERKLDNVLDDLREKTGKIVRKSDSSFCKSISSLVYICLKTYGIERVELRNIKMMLGNHIAVEIFRKYGLHGLIFFVQNKVSDTYTLGIGYTDDINDFHTVLIIGDYILDMTANQMNRPQHEVSMSNFFVKMSDLTTSFESIIDFHIKKDNVKPNGLIFCHPELDSILNSISKNISKLLGREYIAIDSRKYYKPSHIFECSKDKFKRKEDRMKQMKNPRP